MEVGICWPSPGPPQNYAGSGRGSGVDLVNRPRCPSPRCPSRLRSTGARLSGDRGWYSCQSSRCAAPRPCPSQSSRSRAVVGFSVRRMRGSRRAHSGPKSTRKDYHESTPNLGLNKAVAISHLIDPRKPTKDPPLPLFRTRGRDSASFCLRL